VPVLGSGAEACTRLHGRHSQAVLVMRMPNPFSRLVRTCQAAQGMSKYVRQQGEADDWHKAMPPA
jgi:hypothetical protein